MGKCHLISSIEHRILEANSRLLRKRKIPNNVGRVRRKSANKSLVNLSSVPMSDNDVMTQSKYAPILTRVVLV